jgi:hypothetical protein
MSAQIMALIIAGKFLILVVDGVSKAAPYKLQQKSSRINLTGTK